MHTEIIQGLIGVWALPLLGWLVIITLLTPYFLLYTLYYTPFTQITRDDLMFVGFHIPVYIFIWLELIWIAYELKQ